MFLFKRKPKTKVSASIVSVDPTGHLHAPTSTASSRRKTDKLLKDREKRQKIEQKYKPVLDKHFGLISAIKAEYGDALKKGIDSQAMDRIVVLCREDIDLTDRISDYCDKIGDPLYRLPAYERLAIIYEKRGEIDKAMDVCRASIFAGNQPQEVEERLKKLEEKKQRIIGVSSR